MTTSRGRAKTALQWTPCPRRPCWSRRRRRRSRRPPRPSGTSGRAVRTCSPRGPLKTAARRAGSIVALAALDLCGLTLGLYAALVLRAAVLEPKPILYGVLWRDGVAQWLPFLSLITVLVFWRAGLYAPRELREGNPGTILGSLVVVALLSFAFAFGSGHTFETYGIFPTGVVLSAIAIAALRSSYEVLTGGLMRVAGVTRRALLVGDGAGGRAPAPDARLLARRDRLRVRRRDRPDARGRRPARARRPLQPAGGARHAAARRADRRRRGDGRGDAAGDRRAGPPPRRAGADRAEDDGSCSSTAASTSRARARRCSSCARRRSSAPTGSPSARSTSSSAA